MVAYADELEDIYELSPMQRGMLFHTLYAPHSGVYIEQAILSIEGALAFDTFHTAWQRVIDRHATLRTAFLWEELDEPMQVVYQHVHAPWEHLDWRDLPPNDHQARLEELLATDRMRGFELDQPPLLRLTMVRTTNDTVYLLLTHHHLLLDGWSLNIVLQEIWSAYRALRRGEEPLFKPRRPYRDYIAWLYRQNLAEAEVFWRNYLQGFTTPTPLLLESGGQPETQDGDGSHNGHSLQQVKREFQMRGGRPVELQGIVLPQETSTALRAFARHHQLTLNTLLQGAWALLLSRYSADIGQPLGSNADIVFGTTVAGRPGELAGAEAMVGLFINTLPVRVRIPAQADLLSWLTQLQAQQVEARQYEFTPLVQVHGWSEVPRDQTLFTSLVVFENFHEEGGDEHDETEPEAPDKLHVRALQALEQTNFPLVLIIIPGTELEIQLGYETARFTPAAISRTLDALCILLKGFLAGSHTRLADISLLSADERKSLLAHWREAETESTSPWNVTVIQLFQDLVARTPDALALSYYPQNGQQGQDGPSSTPTLLTYAELDRRSNQLAHYLRQLGIGPEAPVGLCIERSPDTMIGLLGILKAGGAYVPLDPSYPLERLASMIASTQHTQPLLVLTQRRFLSRLPASHTRVLCIDEAWPAIEQESTEPPPVSILPANAAYIIYTSGSAGMPKGVMITHHSLVNHCLATGKRYALRAGDRVLQFASISFDVAIEELLPSWLHGATVVMWPDPIAPTPAEFSRFVGMEQLTVLNLPSTYWHEWVMELARSQARLSFSIRAMIVGSEKVSATHLNAWHDVMGHHISWYNAYGLTETTITSLLYEPNTREARERNASIPIGQPIANTQVYILDTQLQPVPSGMPGELYIGGAGLARGYFQRPDLTAERFVPHPFSNIPGARLYRTGDLVRVQEHGNLEFLGRADTQVKLRGFRIEPGEIESQLHQHAAVGDALVMVREDTPNDPRLVAYIVPAPDASAQFLSGQLRTHLQGRLPGYMVPTAFVLLDTFPRGPSGKIDPRALPAPERLHTSAGETFIAPRTPLEEILANIWTAVLRLELVGRTDNFFKLGGHSLQATQVVARIREILRIELPVRAIYDAPTITALASSIEHVRSGAQKLAKPPLQRADRKDLLPLSFAQQRLWFLDQLQPDSPLYNIPGSFYIRDPLSIRALQQSLNALVQRHEPLRTTFAMHAGQPVQIIAPELDLPLPLVDLSGIVNSSTRGAEAIRLARQEAQRPFHLQQGPLVRTTLLRLGANEHILLLTLHHIFADGWSADIFFNELHAHYTAYTTGAPVSLPNLSIQYADYAVWQQNWLQGDTLEHLLAYWRTQLAGIPAALDLPVDHPRPAIQTFRGARHSISLPPALAIQLKALSQQEGVTLFMTLLAALQVLLSRYSGRTDIVIGTPIAGRTHIEIERLIGFFVNTLVLRTELADNPTFKEALVRVRETALAAYTHQDLPFEKLVEELHPERSLSQSPIFQVLFVLHTISSGGFNPNPSGQSLNLEQLDIGSGTAKFDLSFELIETTASIEGYIEYNTDLFEPATIQRMEGHYTTLLSSIVADPEQRIATLPLLTPPESRQILEEWTATHQAYPQSKCLHTLFEAQAAQTPEQVAVVFEDQHLTYQALNERANQLAHALQALGVGPDAPVGLCLERSLEMITGVLGVLKAGGAYVPLDPGYPSQRLAFLLTDTNMSVLLTQQRLLERLSLGAQPLVADHHTHVLCLDSAEQDLARQPNTQPPSLVQPENLAYIIYTSGSTGTPKGVAMPHAPLANLFSWQQALSTPHPATRTLQFASLSFDVASQEIFCSVGFGHTLVVLTEEVRRDPVALLTLLNEQAVERLFLPVVALQQLAEAATSEENGQAPVALREVITAGEKLQITPQVTRLFERLPATALYNQYGPSESHVVSCYQLEGKPSSWPVLPSIGRPIANSALYALDQHMQPVPLGVAGELYLGGVGIARGYLARPDLTAERFVPHPFSHSPGARLYRTGDLVRYGPAGNLEFLGRLDQQVKVRGFRVEPGEIEAVLARHPAVQEVVVLVREGTPADKRLVAYVVTAQTGVSVNGAELRQYLQQQLPAYMIPTHIVLLERLPLTPNGKVDRPALPIPDTLEREPAATSLSAHSLLQEVLMAIWSDILRVERVGLQDNFFDLGGHSLLATRVIARIREVYNVTIPLRTLFEAPILAELAARIEAVRNDTSLAPELPPLIPRLAKITLPLSYAQERLWFLHQLEPASPAYNVPVALRVQGALNHKALQESLNALLQRHEILRTTFTLINDQPRQIIEPQLEITIQTKELLHADAQVQQQEAQRQAVQEIARTFDLSHGPLVRALLLRLSEYDHLLLLTMHHSITDGWSTSIVVNELDAIYRAISAGTPHSLATLPIQYADYAAWQRQWLQGEELERQVAYWRQQLRGAPAVLDLPGDHPRPPAQTYRGNVSFFALPSTLSRELALLSRREATTLFMTLLAAFKVLLMRYSGQTDIVVGTPIAGRTRGETENLIGLFINTLALRTNLAGNPTFRALLGRVREVCLQAYIHQDAPFEKVIEAVQPERNLSHHPIFQVMFILQNAPLGVQFTESEHDPNSALRPHPLVLGEAATKFDLTVELVESPEGLHGIVEYTTDIFELATIERLIRNYQQLLAGIVARPDEKLSLLPLLDEVEQRRLLFDWNATSSDNIPELCVQQLFEKQVERTPEKIALVYEDAGGARKTLTYAELNRRANQLAHLLHAQGVQPEVVVGVYLERSLEMMVALFGILKAGGAYVPLDPTHPAERLAFMLQETQAPILLTHRRLLHKLPPYNGLVINLDSNEEELAGQNADNLPGKVTATNLAYVIYTSGSTGQPKGVMITHGGLTNYLLWSTREYCMEQGQGLLAHSSLASDLSVTTLFAPLLVGQRLTLLSEEQGIDALGNAISQARDLSLVKLTPAHLTLIAGQLAAENVAGRVRALIIGGEALLREHVAFWQAHAPETRLINEYGPTETVVGCCVYELPAGSQPSNSGAVPIGRPIANTQIYLLDQELQSVPIGVPGEVYIAGAGVARGYLQRPDLTAERFLPNPFSKEPGGRMYRTGDLARYIDAPSLPGRETEREPVIEFLGRNDAQVKLRGYRVELGEIEAALKGHSGVQEAVVLQEKGTTAIPGESRLIAYLVERPDAALAPPELRTYLRARLPDYMVPAFYVTLGTLPLLPNGKIDRRTLSALGQNTQIHEHVGREPRDPVEEALIGIWAEVLGRPQLGIYDNFFDLGGHSLLITRVISRVRQSLQVELPLRTLFEKPTIAEFAEAIIQQELEQADNDELMQLLAELEELSPDTM